ncbi:hypothetical protein DM02DRAFT_511306 [Periconia macrospinosa]|uniref:Rhodopsin domain-containing protein n=1 Tax=Periconia macrospinosa TaxID=97972 RepID=A0A2V1EDG1_9PLEO|nr:hypothetical protein DM02DRAFT_511306 [Periconia macrospinosa]
MDGFPKIPPEVLAEMAKEDISHKVIVCVGAFTAMGFISVFLRMFSRAKFVGLVGLEDYLIILSMIFSVCTSICLIGTAKWGNGRHMLNLPPQNGMWILKWLYFSILAYHCSLTTTKLSILWQYRRIFTYKQMRLAIYGSMGLCLACGIIGVVCATFTCIPIKAYWHYEQRPFAKCVNQDMMYHANAGLNISTDLLVAVLPVRAIWKLKIAMRQKIALLVILTLGWFVVVISVIRLYILIQVAKNPMDTSWYGGPAAIWSALEINLAIFCASAPALRPLVVAVIPAFAASLGGSKRSNDASDPSSYSNQTADSRNSHPFIKLKGKRSQSTVNDDIDLERSITALPHAERFHGEIHVTKDFETLSARESRRPSDTESSKVLFPRSPVLPRRL